MLVKEDFTTNEEIDNIQIGDCTVDIIGYVTKVNHNSVSSRGNKFYKFVVDNAQGREVQVIAWKENIPILEKIKQMGSIVHVNSTRASAIKNSSYNSGNVNFELLIKENSTVEDFGAYVDNKATTAEEISISKVGTRINKKIKVKGIIKTPLREYKNKDIVFSVGSITDGIHKLELKTNFDCSKLTWSII